MSKLIPYNQPLVDAHDAVLSAEREWLRVAKELFPVGMPVSVWTLDGSRPDGIVRGYDKGQRIHVEVTVTRDTSQSSARDRYTTGLPGPRHMMLHAGAIAPRSVPDAE